MINVCQRCGLYRVDKEIDPAGPWAICPECGERHRFVMAPFLAIGGPSGAGKTSVLRRLVASDEVLERRLAGRPSWRASGSREFVSAQCAFSRSLRETATTAGVALRIVDTTNQSEEETSAVVGEWIRSMVTPE